MLLDLDNVCGLNELLSDGGAEDLERLTPAAATLAGLVELGALAETATHSPHRELLARWIAQHAGRWPVLQSITQSFRNQFVAPNTPTAQHAAPEFEIWPLADKGSITADAFTLYQMRFERTLKAAGFPPKFATAIVAGFSEMTDNVIQHSSSSTLHIAGVAGFHVSPGAMNYVVTDIGQGALVKLQTNPRWASLASERDALIAIGRDGATSRPLRCGGGYYQVFESFLDRQGLVKMRSGDGLAQLTGNLTKRHAEGANTQHLRGFRVFVACTLNGDGRELCC